MLIDTSNQKEMQRYEQIRQQLIVEKLEKGKYDASDIAIVRATDHLPVDNKVVSLSNVPFVIKQNDLAHEAVDSIFEDQGLSYADRKQMARDMSPLSTKYRSSIHFCLNGVVLSHYYGNFDDYPFVIIEPFKYHENDNNILAVRGEDTYFENELALSQDAKILVDEKYADKVLESGIDESKVIFYKGDREKATEVVLLEMGVVPEVIGKDYIIESDTSDLIRNFINEKKYPADKHCFSESYRQDDLKTEQLMQKYASDYYTYLYNSVYGDITGKEEEVSYLSTATPYSQIALYSLKNVINQIGLDKYKEIVDTYNSSIMEKVASGQYATNNQILEGAPLGYSNSAVHK